MQAQERRWSMDSSDVAGAECALMERAEAKCRERFGYAGLHSHQKQVLRHVFAGRDCLAVLPTGSGKSLCYVLPALVRPGLTLVVSPLISLIRDQMRRFASLGIAAAAFDSLQTPEEREQVWRRVDGGELNLVFMSPERLARHDFRDRLKARQVQLVAVDEAHCVSHWGNHFRPDYRTLGDNLGTLGERAQMLALTATATNKVRRDIEARLKLITPAFVFEDFVRQNLEIKVIRADKTADQWSAVLNGVLSLDGPGIVYAPTRKVVEEVTRMLRSARMDVTCYHAGMPPDQRNLAQRRFFDGSVRVVVATHAFGMGIDKANIRFVHHVGMPASLEQYVQEIGRAGRDGMPARCWLIYGPRDYHIQKFMIEKTFPAPERLAKALESALFILRQGAMVSEQTVVRGIVHDLGGDERMARGAIELLCSEGLLSALRRGGSPAAEVLLAEGATAEAGRFFAEYPLRKAENLAKLDAMKAYAGGKDDRMRLIEDYFRQ